MNPAERDSDLPPTLPAIPRPPRVPTAVNWHQVDEVRYDREHATCSALNHAGQPRHSAVEYVQLFDGLSTREEELLVDARCGLIMRARRLGAR